MSLYSLCVGLHLLALSLWLGHMFAWSLFTGPAMKRIEPPATAEELRAASQTRAGLGWPALAILVPTGLYMLSYRGINPGDLLTAAAYQGAQGKALAVKLTLVAAMVVYQAVFGHKPSSVAIHLNILAALVVIAASVVLVRGWV